jgi:hypothetical protein
MRYVAAIPLVAASLIASVSLPECANAQSNPYSLDRLFLMPSFDQPLYQILSFNNETEVANYYGATSYQAHLASDFYANGGAGSATMLFTRYPEGGARAHLYGANISNMTLQQLQATNGSISLTSQGYAYSGSVNLTGVSSFSAAASAMTKALDQTLPVAAVTTGSSITPVTVSFTGSIKNLLLDVKSVSSGSIQIGSIVSGHGIPANAQIISQQSGTPNGAGVYSLFVSGGTISTETMTSSYGKLTIGSTSSGAVQIGQNVTGSGIARLTAIEANLSGSGAGSTWLVNNAQTVAGENMTMTGAPLYVEYLTVTGKTANRAWFEIQQEANYMWNSSSISTATGAAAASLGLTQAEGALASSPGQIVTTASAWMNNFINNESDQFYSFQSAYNTKSSIPPGEQSALEAWAQSTDGRYSYLEGWSANTPPIVDSLNSAAAPIPGAPEPSTWALILLGFAGLGFAQFRLRPPTYRSGRLRLDHCGAD